MTFRTKTLHEYRTNKASHETVLNKKHVNRGWGGTGVQGLSKKVIKSKLSVAIFFTIAIFFCQDTQLFMLHALLLLLFFFSLMILYFVVFILWSWNSVFMTITLNLISSTSSKSLKPIGRYNICVGAMTLLSSGLLSTGLQ